MRNEKDCQHRGHFGTYCVLPVGHEESHRDAFGGEWVGDSAEEATPMPAAVDIDVTEEK